VVKGLAMQISAYQEWRSKDTVVGWYLLCTNKWKLQVSSFVAWIVQKYQ